MDAAASLTFITFSLVKWGSYKYVFLNVRNLFSGIFVTSKSHNLSKNFKSPNNSFLASSQVSLKPNNKQQLVNTVTTNAAGDVNDLRIFNYVLSIF